MSTYFVDGKIEHYQSAKMNDQTAAPYPNQAPFLSMSIPKILGMKKLIRSYLAAPLSGVVATKVFC